MVQKAVKNIVAIFNFLSEISGVRLLIFTVIIGKLKESKSQDNIGPD